MLLYCYNLTVTTVLKHLSQQLILGEDIFCPWCYLELPVFSDGKMISVSFIIVFKDFKDSSPTIACPVLVSAIVL